MTKNIRNILVMIEQNGQGGLLPQSLETLGMAVQLLHENSTKLFAALLSEGDGSAEELRHYPVDRIYHVPHPNLSSYHPEFYRSAMSKVIEESEPDIILGAHTLNAIDLFPSLALALDAGLVMDCVEVHAGDSGLEVHKPVYSGNVIAVYTPESMPCLLSINPRLGAPVTRSASPGADIVTIDVDFHDALIRQVKQVRDDEDGIKLSDAKIVVAGGRGMGGEEGFELLYKIAEKLGGAVGASRPPCDLEWVSPKTQVGLTGEVVAPDLYIAVGISGSFQHLAGMADAKVIVAVNRDEKANIFKVAHYGVAGDYEDIVPAFIDELEQLLIK